MYKIFTHGTLVSLQYVDTPGRYHVTMMLLKELCLLVVLAVFGSNAYMQCSPGYRDMGGICLKFIARGMNYQNAVNECRRDQAFIAMPKNGNIQHQMNTMRQQNGNHEIWIGLNDMNRPNQYYWADGHRFGGYSNWNRGEPTGNPWENCVHMLRSGKWNDCPCSENFMRVICQKAKVRNYCSPNPCKNGAPCTGLHNDFRCTCRKGYKGKTCNEVVNHCAPNPCHNGANCKSWAGGFKCECPRGFEGVTCGSMIKHCDNKPPPCKNGAQCINMIGDFKCVCPPGFTGKACDKAVNHCAPNPCKNGAACTSHATDFSCACPKGYKGKTCSEVINNCSPNPCHNGAKCTSLIGDFKCTCPKGFEGKTCGSVIRYCDKTPSPCKNGAQCINMIGDFKCVCQPGYTGKTCDKAPVNHCKPMPCQNGGTCTSSASDFKCTCPKGFTGKRCEKANKNHCIPMPCLNEGVCVNLANDFRCDCKLGWKGKICETPVRHFMLERDSNKVNFDKNYGDYEKGFGSCPAVGSMPSTGNCWVGLTKLHEMCHKNCKLQIAMWYKGEPWHAVYNKFKVGPPSDKYRVSIGGYSSASKAADDLSPKMNGMQFTTKDQDNDKWGNNCAATFTGGWWHNACFQASPTGTFGSTAFAKGINWKSITGFDDSLDRIIMKVTPMP